MIQSAVAGFGLGLSLILAIGAQNVFVLRQGLRGAHVFAICVTCALSDAILIAVGVAGFGWLVGAVPWIAPVMRWAGAVFLLLYGGLAFRSAWRGGAGMQTGGAPIGSLKAALATCLALTWLNPHVYLDTVVLLGSVAAQWQPWPFGIGAASASFLYFFGLGYGARFLRPLFAMPGAWRVLDITIGVIMWSVAAGLVLE